MSSAADVGSALRALGHYERRIRPQAQAELRRWEGVAEGIPDPVLRQAALASLREKGSNAEAIAVFAILAPRPQRATALRAMTTLQVAVDYLDTLGEQPAEDPLQNGLTLHEALADALSPDSPLHDWYRLHPQHEDGGYLAALVASCRQEVDDLPATEAVLKLAQRAARRCGEGQSHTHAAAMLGSERLAAWAKQQASPAGYLWWEVAAGASSSVAAHALIAAAGDVTTTVAEAELIDAAYFPSIGALTVLLDGLVDRSRDLAAGEHNYLSYYASNEIAAERMALIARQAREASTPLPRARLHRTILAGVAAYYLSAPEVRDRDYARPIRERMLGSLDFTVRPILAATRLRRRRQRTRSPRSARAAADAGRPT